MKKISRVFMFTLCLFIQCLVIANSKDFNAHAATSIPTNGHFMEGQIAGSGKQLTYDLNIPRTSKLILTTMAYGNMFFEVYNEDGNILYHNESLNGTSSSPHSKAMTLYMSAGRYKVVMKKAYALEEKPVSFKVKATLNSFGCNEKEPNDFDHAMKVNASTTITGGLTEQDAEDWYKITTSARFVNLNLKAYSTMRIEVYNSDLTKVLNSSYLYGGEAAPEQKTFEFRGSSTYYVRIYRSAYNSGGKYTFKWVNGTVPTAKNVKVAKYKATSLKVSWDTDNQVDYYQVYRSTNPKGKFSLLGTYNPRWDNYKISSSLKTGTKYYYKVRGYKVVNDYRVYGDFSPVVSATPTLSAPKNLIVSSSYNKQTIYVNWDYDQEASFYQVYRSTNANGKYVLLGTYGQNTTYKYSTSLKSGQRYYYKVRSYKWVNGKRVFSPFCNYRSAVAK